MEDRGKQAMKNTTARDGDKIASFFFKNSLAFNIIKDPYLMKFCHTLRPSFVLPSLYQLKTTYLDREYEDKQKSMDEAIEEAIGVTIVIDGWSNVRRDDIVNIILCTPKPYFHSSINTGDNSKTAVYLKTIIDPIILKYGPLLSLLIKDVVF